MQISFLKLHELAQVPVYQTSGSAAADISACIEERIVLSPGERAVIPTGFAIAVPLGYEAQVRARSGLSSRHGVCLANGVGTIDADYRGEVGVVLINLGDEPFTVEPAMRIAQLAVVKVEQASWIITNELDSTERGKGGYGSTGR